MPTPSEQKALTFVAIVILLGGAVRVLRASSSSAAPTPLEQQALARQASAADSAAAKARSAKAGKHAKSASVAHAATAAVTPNATPGFPPPGLRIDTDVGGQQPVPTTGRVKKATGKPVVVGPIDLDVATEQEIEALPRVGPVIARKIVANRDSFGPFRSMDGLKRVKGIGTATAQALAPLVTFGGKGGTGALRP